MMRRHVHQARFLLCCAIAFCALGMVLVREVGRLTPTLWLSAFAASVLPMLAGLLWQARSRGQRDGADRSAPAPRWMLDSAHSMIFATTFEGVFTYVNPSAERAFALRSADLVGKRRIQEFFADGELERVQKSLARVQPELAAAAQGLTPFEFCVRSLSSLPPSQVRPVHFQLRPAQGQEIPASLFLSVLRDDGGQARGLLAVAQDQRNRSERHFALRESSERYRDLFDHAMDPIAVLSAEARFLYANPSWRTCFGLDESAFQRAERLEDIFDPTVRQQVAEQFRKALGGTSIDGFPLQTRSRDGRPLELEISLSTRRKGNSTATVRCIVRDVTQQRRRERRLALQLTTTQIISQSASPQSASVRILETLCLSLGWDAAFLWQVSQDGASLQFHVGWTSPDQQMDGFLQQTMMHATAEEVSLAEESLRRRCGVWVEDFSAAGARWTAHPALRFGLTCGWATAIRAGNRMIAVLEFFSRHRMHEDQETVATVDTVLTPLGQMLARSREQERADELHHTQKVLLDTIADGICATDGNGAVTTMNPAAARLLRVEAAEEAGHDLHTLLHGARPGGMTDCAESCVLLAGLKQHKSTGGEIAIWRRDRSSFPAEFSLTPILENGRYSGTVMSFRDITQRFALDKLKDEFVSTVSHELRTPLTSIRGALGLLSSGILGEVNEKAANLLRIALSNSDRLVRLINDILDLERIQSGREPLSFRPVALNDIVQQAMDGMAPVADAAEVQLIHDANAIQLNADADRLLQVLTNLLSNAIKFSPRGATVSVTLRAGSGAVVLSVIDQGRGIPADKLDTIFDRFQQVDASDSRQKGGSGLGLAICKTIVRQHGGKIWAERNAVRGSTFRVLLPFHPKTEKADEIAPEESATLGTLLIADANEKSRASVAAMLRRQGYQVVEAATAQATLDGLWEDRDKLVPRELEAILLDASLDKFYGWEILPQLRQQPAAQQVPIVLLSMSAPDVLAALPMGADGWIQKTDKEDEMLRDLAHVLSVPGESARILVVEDDEDLARIIADVFARSGMQVQQAHTRQDALNFCLSFRPQLIVLDLSLPDGDGFNVVDWLKQNEEFAHLPLVVYSAREIPQDERSLLQLGPTQFLTKARVQPQQLESLVLTMLRRSRQRRESALVDPAAEAEMIAVPASGPASGVTTSEQAE